MTREAAQVGEGNGHVSGGSYRHNAHSPPERRRAIIVESMLVGLPYDGAGSYTIAHVRANLEGLLVFFRGGVVLEIAST
jgi:hypothetical protein